MKSSAASLSCAVLLLLVTADAEAGPRARVYPLNPVADGQTVQVELTDLPAGATTLTDSDVRVLNCIDERQCHAVKTVAGVRDVHYCQMRPTALAGANGDFLHITPPAQDTANEDAFAEVQAYYHVKRALQAFRVMAGDPQFRLRNRLDIVVNMRAPNLSSTVSMCDGRAHPSSRLSREDNAYFWPAGELGPVELGDRIVLAQGVLTDFAYDGEVVYHEVTHAVMNTTTTLGWMRLDERGLDPSPGALHEGFSDYFAATISGNPDLSWYAGTTEDGPAPMGTLLALDRCTDILVGEEHDESKPWASALWAIRRSLRSQAKRAMLDRALFRVISMLRSGDGVREAHALVLTELASAAEKLIVDDALDAEAAAYLRATVASAPEKFAERGLPSCGDRILEVRPADVKSSLYAKGPYTWSSPVSATQQLPASMQFALDISADTTAVQLYVDYSYPLSDEIVAPGVPVDPDLVVLASPNAPITWTWQGDAGTHDAVYEVPLKIVNQRYGTATATLERDLPAGTYYFQVANRGADWGLGDIQLLVADEHGDLGDGKYDSSETSHATSAGCSTTGSHTGSFLMLLGLAFLLVARRRR